MVGEVQVEAKSISYIQVPCARASGQRPQILRAGLAFAKTDAAHVQGSAVQCT